MQLPQPHLCAHLLQLHPGQLMLLLMELPLLLAVAAAAAWL